MRKSYSQNAYLFLYYVLKNGNNFEVILFSKIVLQIFKSNADFHSIDLTLKEKYTAITHSFMLRHSGKHCARRLYCTPNRNSH